eukprot:SAG31_NODE_15240_length_764_cov_0.846617_1_plen_128_part_10
MLDAIFMAATHSIECSSSVGIRGELASSKYVAVVLQYGERFKKEKLERLLRKLGGVSKKDVSVQFATAEDALALTGFIHNAIVPVGTNVGRRLPVVLSHGVELLLAFWLGGGTVRMKMRCQTSAFLIA